MNIYGEITKIETLDDGTIMVFGSASSGAIDDADETVLPMAMKAALPAYMKHGVRNIRQFLELSPRPPAKAGVR